MAGDIRDSGVRGLLRSRCYWGGALIGIGVMAAVDEIVFHQILGWHHFYDRSTPMIGLISDGLLHAFELFAVVAGCVAGSSGRRPCFLVMTPPVNAWRDRPGGEWT